MWSEALDTTPPILGLRAHTPHHAAFEQILKEQNNGDIPEGSYQDAVNWMADGRFEESEWVRYLPGQTE